MSRPIYRTTPKPGDVWFIPGDMHVPVMMREAFAVAWRWFLNQPGKSYGVILPGDDVDTSSLSEHPQDERMDVLMDEILEFRPYLEEFAATPLGVDWIEGNHEWRAQRVIRKHARGLIGAPGLRWPKLTGVDDIRGLRCHPHGGRVALGPKVIVEHGDCMRGGKTGNKKVDAVLRDYPDQTTLYGHTHRAAVAYRTVLTPEGPRVRAAINLGAFERADAMVDFSPDGDHQAAFATVEFLDRGLFSARLHLVIPDPGAPGGWVVV